MLFSEDSRHWYFEHVSFGETAKRYEALIMAKSLCLISLITQYLRLGDISDECESTRSLH